MKKLILSTIFLLIAFTNVKAQSEVYYSANEPGVIIEPILYFEAPNNFLTMRASSNHDEIDYIGYNTSNVNVIYFDKDVYISWNVCDDLSESLYILHRTTDNVHHTLVGCVQNIPCSPNVPLLYSLQDKNVILDKPYFYKLYKVLENGSMVHIITIILPKQKDNTISSN